MTHRACPLSAPARRQLDEFEAYKQAYAQKHGAATLAVLEKHTDEFVALHRQMVHAMMAKPAK
jgi:hypothetical protein